MRNPWWGAKSWVRGVAATVVLLSMLVSTSYAASGTTERVSVANNGDQGNDETRGGSISADGRFVTLLSYSSNLVEGDTNDAADIFVRDRQKGTTVRVSVDSAGNQANSWSTGSTGLISGNGRYVVFESHATNLVPNDTDITTTDI